MRKQVQGLVIRVLSWPILSWRLRTRLYRFVGAHIGPESTIGNGCDMAGQIDNLILGDRVFINSNGYFQLAARIEIEDDVRLGPFVRILTRHHPIEPSIVRRRAGADTDVPCRIGRGSWIGMGVSILPSASIAEGCVIASGSVVTRSTTPNGLYAGVPAKRVKDLALSGERAALSAESCV